jgi:hypothetical protein
MQPQSPRGRRAFESPSWEEPTAQTPTTRAENRTGRQAWAIVLMLLLLAVIVALILLL